MRRSDGAVRQGAWGLLLGLVVAGSLAPAAAHDLWLLPSSFEPEEGADVSVRVLVGHEPAHARPLPRRPDWLERFELVGPGGAAEVRGVAGTDPAGYAAVGPPGLYAVVLESGETRHALTPERFTRFLAEEGLEESARTAGLRGVPGEPVREVFARSVKSLLRAGGTAPGGAAESAPGVDLALGLELELVPLDDPFGAVGPGLRFRVLRRGEGAAGVRVDAGPLAGGAPPVWAVSDSEGRVELALPARREPVAWLLTAVMLEPAPEGSGAEWRSLWTSLTFQRPGRGRDPTGSGLDTGPGPDGPTLKVAETEGRTP